MEIMRCTVRRQQLDVDVPTLVALTYDYINVKATFSSEWAGMQKWLHVRNVENQSIIAHVLFNNDEIGEDVGLNLSAGEWDVWIHGALYEDNTLIKRITTNVKKIKVEATGSEDEILPSIGPSVAEQAVAAAERAEAAADEAEDSAEAAAGYADSAQGYADAAHHEMLDANIAANDARNSSYNAQLAATNAQNYAAAAEAAVSHYPYIDAESKTWHVWDATNEEWDDTQVVAEGGTFTPSVDEYGNLSWTNNAGLPNPSPVNLVSLFDNVPELQARMDEILAEAEAGVADIEEQRDTILASIASAAQLGTDTTLTTAGMAADAKATGDEFAKVKNEILAANVSEHNVIVYNGERSIAATSSWPDRLFVGNVIKINGSFSNAATNYYTPLDNPNSTTTGTTALNGKPKNIKLTKGHYYRLSGFVLSGTVTIAEGTDLLYKIKNESNATVASTSYNGSQIFKWDYDGKCIVFLHAMANQSFNNAVLAYSLTDITEELCGLYDRAAPNNGRIYKSLSAYGWVNGKQVTRGRDITTPTSATNTISSTVPIPYDWKTRIRIKSDNYKYAFVSVEEQSGSYVVVGIAKGYTTFTSGAELSMLDVFNSLAYATASVFGTHYAIMIRRNDDTDFSIDDVDIDDIIDISEKLPSSTLTPSGKWVAIGDSITDGRYSQSDGTTVRTKTNHFCQYDFIASKILNFSEFEEHGEGGMGYIHVSNDGLYLSDVLAHDFGSPKLITVCLGVNDRSETLGDENSTANDGTISGAVRYCAETLGAAYKDSHIVFLTPMNCSGTGNLSTGWAKNSGTTHLSDIAEIIKYWANKYGFPVVDLLNECPVNDFNIEEMLPDSLHPSMSAHLKTANFLAAKLPVIF